MSKAPLVIAPGGASVDVQRLAEDINRSLTIIKTEIRQLQDRAASLQAGLDALDARVTALEP
jgi:hypothetical protein